MSDPARSKLAHPNVAIANGANTSSAGWRLKSSSLVLVALGIGLVLGFGHAAWAQPPDDLTIDFRPRVTGLNQPVDVESPNDGSGRLFIVEKPGTIRIFDGQRLLPAPFLDLRDRVASNGERGLLGLAFHPQYRQNGFFFVHFTNTSGNTRIVRFRVSANPNRANAASGVTLLAVGQPFSNHNGGDLAFGPDGMLYASIGDGGSGGDPQRNGQNRNTLLGTLVRLDVDSQADGARPPADNPFVGVAGRNEIWVYGLRNPWRFSFDRMTGDLFIGDVGQRSWEEIDFQPASSRGGENFGWNVVEGPDCFEAASCSRASFTDPILNYGRGDGASVTGGFRYRGQRFALLAGVYVYGDFVSGRIWGARPDANGTWRTRQLARPGFPISTFGEDANGELLVADFGGGRILGIVASGGSGGGGGGGGGDCPLPPGHPRFCVECGPCAAGQGDCDRDGECAAGLMCADNVGTDFGFGPRIDVCVTAPSGCPWLPGHPRFCRDCGPCIEGIGDCDNDQECVAGARCVQNNGADFGFSPGIDVCVGGGLPPGPPPPGACPLPPGHPDFCRDCGPCRDGEGDCDRDNQCAPGLRCIDDIGPQFGFGQRVDVCRPS